MEIFRTIEEAPRYRISSEGRIINVFLNRGVRIKYLGGGRAYVVLNVGQGQPQRQLFVDELMEEYFGPQESDRTLGARYGSTHL